MPIANHNQEGEDMIKIVASHSLKLPLPGEQYSSHGYSASLEAEVADADASQILAKTAELFRMAKVAVEAQLNGKAAVPAQESPKASPAPTETRDAPAHNGFRGTNGNGDAAASGKQLNFLLSLAKKHWGYPKMEAVLRDEFHVQGPENLTKRQCSDLIERLQKGANNGGRK